MDFLEKDLEEIIYNSTKKQRDESGLCVGEGKAKRQLRIGSYGVADLVYVEKDYEWDEYSERNLPFLNITICELKKDKAGISAFLQSVRYMKGISRYLNKRNPSLLYKFEIVIIGKKIDINSDYVFLSDFIEPYSEFYCLSDLRNYSYSYDFKGIRFKQESGYCITEEKF